ncbi:MAG: FliH/SctL family protein [Acidobacteria bacterium]|nr:FliH/SctL family protein [Acidobacteriota bacterium]
MSSKILGSAQTAERLIWLPLGGELEEDVEAVEEEAPPPPPPEPPRELLERIATLEQDVIKQGDLRYRQGMTEGIQEGERRAAKLLEPLQARLAATVTDLAGTQRGLRREAEADVVRMALAIARRILNRELSVDPEAILGLVRSALDRLEAREIHRLRVAPTDKAAVEAELARRSLPRSIEVYADPSLERGAAVFETSRGTLDSSINTQLDEIDRGLADLVGRRP